jgi:RNA polymerase sigma factor (sigma-70 family)
MTDEKALPAQGGTDAQHFTELYQQWYRRVFNYILYRAPEPDDVEDLAMQVFEKALKSLPQYDARRGPFAAWLFAIARNVLNDYHRRRRFAWLPLAAFREQPDAARSLEETYARGEEHKLLLQALARLSDRERDILGLKFAARLNNRQIAAAVGLSESNVGVIIYRSLQKLRGYLEADGRAGREEIGRD